MHNPDCLFCKIAQGTIPCHKIYEDQHTLAFLDIKQVNEGHTLVIPKEHCENIFDVDKETLTCTMLTVKKVALTIKKALGLTGINISTNNGKPGQEIFHLHFHIIPRFENDGLIMWPAKTPTPEQLKIMAEKIRKAF
ncbi:MAG: HIT family protein [Nanoarchaeota archaeon]|nr:HIT family protein [Nanoarchaeota archaeon]